MMQAPADNRPLHHLEYLGSGADMQASLRELLRHTHFFDDFQPEELARLFGLMQVYRAQASQWIIREGDVDDFMLLIIDGKTEIVKADQRGVMRLMTNAGAGATVGEMSMIDGEPRFASCIAVEPTIFAVLARATMVGIILETPEVGAKLLIKLVALLAARLRQTSSTLLRYMEQ